MSIPQNVEQDRPSETKDSQSGLYDYPGSCAKMYLKLTLLEISPIKANENDSPWSSNKVERLRKILN